MDACHFRPFDDGATMIDVVEVARGDFSAQARLFQVGNALLVLVAFVGHIGTKATRVN